MIMLYQLRTFENYTRSPTKLEGREWISKYCQSNWSEAWAKGITFSWWLYRLSLIGERFEGFDYIFIVVNTNPIHTYLLTVHHTLDYQWCTKDQIIYRRNGSYVNDSKTVNIFYSFFISFGQEFGRNSTWWWVELRPNGIHVCSVKVFSWKDSFNAPQEGRKVSSRSKHLV